jgi:hypothetical protein
MGKTDEKAIARQFERLRIAYLAEQRFATWLAEQANPPAPPKPAAAPMSPARAAALGLIQMPAMPIAEAAERESTLEYRRVMRETLTGDMGFATAGWEHQQKVAQFEVEERARWTRAGQLLRRGVDGGSVAVACDLEESEIADIKSQLNL